MAVVERNRKEEIALGMTLLGVVFSSILYGISLSQTYTYYKRFPNDSWKVKLMVVLVNVLDTASMVLVSHASWYYLVTTGPAGRSIWSLNVELCLSMVISALTESFLAYQVWLLSDRKSFLTMCLGLLALVHFISGEISAGEFLSLRNFAKFGSVKIPSILRLSSAAVCDTSLAISLCYFLHQKRTGYKQTDEIIDHLILYTLNSGLINCVTSIFCLITYIVIPRTWVYLALCFLISRLYANTFLSS
ncbi:hypothetical protein CPB85DRAFT_782477 [Mucidula mucida]|nr:hypothetical protein CPB85DRAFT_782477 [Mucidula mucida]